MKWFLSLLAASAGCAAFAAPPQTPFPPPQSPTRAEFDAILARVAKLERGAAPGNCGEANCPANGGAGCACDGLCPCRPAGMKDAAGGRGAVPLVKGYHQGVVTWIPDGWALEGWSRTPPAPAASYGTACGPSGCFPAAGPPGAIYGSYGTFSPGGGVMSGGGCSGGSCGAPAAGGFGSRRR